MISEIYHSPIGDLRLMADGGRIVMVDWVSSRRHSMNLRLITQPSACWPSDNYSDTEDHTLIEDCREQLNEYFSGERTDFCLPTQLRVSQFSERIIKLLTEISYGKRISYKQLAELAGMPNAPRAVAGAVGRNPMSIIYPCHRVISADGSAGGYAGGIDAKKWLLSHELINTH